MNKSEKAIREINSIYELSMIDSPIRRLSPLSKLIVTIIYILVVVSTNKYDLSSMIVLIVYPTIMYTFAKISVTTCFYKLRYALPLVMAVGIFNPFLDKQIIEAYQISGGLISMITLMLKGIYCLMASFILIATTPIEEMCYALRKLHFPKFLTSLLLLTYRYVELLLNEVNVMFTSYKLRAPNQKGLHISTWGTFLGQLILRTIDKASILYESMELRGYNGEFYYVDKNYNVYKSFIFSLLMFVLFALLKSFNFLIFMLGVYFL